MDEVGAEQMSGRVSVCLATYNGARYVAHQLRSILAELAPEDEVVIVDDASSDATADVIRGIGDPRIRLIQQAQNQGYVRTFEAALRAATGDILMLADQDDEWVPGRRRALAAAASATGVAASNLVLLGSEAPLTSPLTGRPWLLRASDSGHRVRNELRILMGDAPYFGCAMALRRDALDAILPFPPYLTESHDLWIATVANATGMLCHIDDATVRRRLHDANASSARPRGLRKALASRALLLRLLSESLRRRARLRRR